MAWRSRGPTAKRPATKSALPGSPVAHARRIGAAGGLAEHVAPPDRYRGIDGTASPRCAEVVDLVEYRSTIPGLFMRHILEHNYEWARILDNALASFTERMALILFTPEQEATKEIAFRSDVGVPDIAFRLADITDRFPPDVTYTVQRIRQPPSTVVKRSSSSSAIRGWDEPCADPRALGVPLSTRGRSIDKL